MAKSNTIYTKKLECQSCHKNKIGIVVSDPSQTSKVLEQIEKNKIILASPSNVSAQWLCKYCYATGQVVYKLESESFYEIQHDFYGCMNPRCRFTYTEDETKTADFADYIKNHVYGGSAPNLIKLEVKVWTLDEVIALEPISGWTPAYTLTENGFDLVKTIDLFEVFGVKERFGVCLDDVLKENKEIIKKILDEIDFENRKLLICRTRRRGLVAWDVFDVFDIGQYHAKKEEMRKNISKYWEEELKKEEIEREKRIAYNKANGIEIPDWETAKKQLDKFIQEKHPENFVFDPLSNTGYDMESVEDRKRLFDDMHKRKRKAC